MEKDKSLPFGSYVEGDSPLHRLDPRWKLLVCVGLVVAAFSSSGWLQVTVALLGVLLLLCSAGQGMSLVFRLLWPFRYLFLFTVLLHTCLSPGYTLFGTTWLSRDGLLLGNLTCLQIAVALVGASLLAITTRPELLARACGWFLAPLRWFGCKVEEWEGLILLTMRFIPVMRERVAATIADPEDVTMQPKFRSRWLDFEAWELKLVSLLDRLVEQADQMAQRVASGEEQIGQTAQLGPLLAVSAIETCVLFAAALLAILYFLIGAV
jgi:energy-coupling factor transport system permease protein